MFSILKKEDIQKFIQDGFIRIDHAFSEKIAEEVREILWQDLPVVESDPASWEEPVIRLGMYTAKPFIDSINGKVLYDIFDQLIGRDKWLPCRSVGSFPVRFPVEKQPDDTGKHVDAGFPGDDPSNFFEWRINIKSKGRALLMLILYSDVTENDAPTVIYKKSHLDVARLLYPEGDKGLSFLELANRLNTLPEQEKAYATGKAGTIYLCHPFLVHAAQPHKGMYPKFMAQPPLLLRNELNITDSSLGFSPVEEAIRCR